MDWNKRSDRIHRLKEKENFRAVIMPLSYWGAGLGFVALLVLAACVTPTSDPFNLGLMFVPLYALFELGLAGMGWAERHNRK